MSKQWTSRQSAAPAAVEEAERLLATFQVGGAYYGLDTGRVQEVIMVGAHTRVHHAPEYVRGVINLRGKIVTVIDLRMKLCAVRSPITADSRILIVAWMGEQVGLLVESVEDVIPLDPERIEPKPSNVSASQERFLDSVYRVDAGERLIGILILDELLDA